MFRWEFCVVQVGTIHTHHAYEQVNFYKKLRLCIIGRPVRDKQVKIY